MRRRIHPFISTNRHCHGNVCAEIENIKNPFHVLRNAITVHRAPGSCVRLIYRPYPGYAGPTAFANSCNFPSDRRRFGDGHRDAGTAVGAIPQRRPVSQGRCRTLNNRAARVPGCAAFVS